MDRRAFLEGGSVAALGGLVPFLAAADRDGWTEGHVAAFLERIAQRKARARARTAGARARLRDGRATSRTPAERAVEELLPAVLGVNVALSAPLRVQVHPDVQRLLHDDLATVGEQTAVLVDALRAGRSHLGVVSDDPGLRDDALAALGSELAGDDLPEPVRVRLRHGLDRFGWDVRRRPPGSVLDEHLAEYDRLVALAAEPAAAAAALRLEDATVVGLAEGGNPDAAKAPLPPGKALAGALILGLGAVGGLVVGGAGVAALVALPYCPCIWLPLLALGGVLVYAGWVLARPLLGIAGPVSFRLTPKDGWVRVPVDAGEWDAATATVLPRYYLHVRGVGALRARLGEHEWEPLEGVFVVPALGQPELSVVEGKVHVRLERLPSAGSP